MKKILSIVLFLVLTTVAFGQKKVLIEQFSNASCVICATYSPQVHDFGKQNEANAVIISYHTSFPYTHDSMHFENPQDANARVSYYGVTGTPYTHLDGGFYKAPSSQAVNSLFQKMGESFNQSPAFQPTIEFKNFRIENNEAKARVIFRGLDMFHNLDMRGHIALVEKVVPKSAYAASPGSNSEQEYSNVMRQMYKATSNGHKLAFTQQDPFDSVEVAFPVTNVKSQKQLRIVAFMQDDGDKRVHTANFEDLEINNPPTSVQEVNGVKTIWSYNPIAKNYVLTFDKAQTGSIIIHDITGKLITTLEIDNEARKVIEVGQFNSGIYVATFLSGNIQSATKLVVE